MKQSAANRLPLGLLLFIILLSFASTAPASSGEAVDEVLVVVKGNEILAFSGLENHWVKERLQINERVLSTKSGGNVAVVATSSRVLGFSALTDRWDAADVTMNEELVEIQVEGNVATVETDRKVLGFSAKSGTWVEMDFGLGESIRHRQRELSDPD